MLLLLDMCLSCMDTIINGIDFEGILEVCIELEVVVDYPREIGYAHLSLL
jgi:hypothetical protein